MNNGYLDILSDKNIPAILKENTGGVLKKDLTERDIIIGQEEIKTFLKPLRYLTFLTLQTKHPISRISINQTGHSLTLKWQAGKDQYAFFYREEETHVFLKKNHIKLNPLDFKTPLEAFRDFAEAWLEKSPYELYHHCYQY